MGLFLIADRRYGLRMLHYIHSIIAFIDGLPARLIKADPRPEDYDWSEVTSLWRPHVRLTDGTWSDSGGGTLWRRRRYSDDRWEYEQDAETLEQQLKRMV
jgi:hypothetical protein